MNDEYVLESPDEIINDQEQRIKRLEQSLAEYKLALELCAQEVPPVLFCPKPSPYIFNDPDHWLTRAREASKEGGG